MAGSSSSGWASGPPTLPIHLPIHLSTPLYTLYTPGYTAVTASRDAVTRGPRVAFLSLGRGSWVPEPRDTRVLSDLHLFCSRARARAREPGPLLYNSSERPGLPWACGPGHSAGLSPGHRAPTRGATASTPRTGPAPMLARVRARVYPGREGVPGCAEREGVPRVYQEGGPAPELGLCPSRLASFGAGQSVLHLRAGLRAGPRL